jgi:hypothetical protein
MRIVLLALLLVGCADAQKRHLGEECDLNSDCAAPLTCRLARCRVECFETRDCPIESGCIRDNEGFGVCLLVDETACDLDSDCLEHLVCAAGQCINECIENRDCTPGTTCDEGACVDTARAMRCNYHPDCEEPLVCVAGSCRFECRSDRDCRGDFVCEKTEGAALGGCAPWGP